MKTIAHISDAHFGAHDPAVAAELLRELNSGSFGAIAISGDLTQRARVHQFRAARAWLDQLEVPWLAVPGNHDLPLYDLFTRFVRPRERYCRYISSDLEPLYFDEAVAMAGIDSTRSLTTKHGRIKPEPLARATERLAELGPRWKIVVAHHPLFVPEHQAKERVEGAEQAIAVLKRAGVDVVLSGHLHTQSIGGRNERHSLLAVQAGTCMSVRLRGEAQSYNQLRIDGDTLTIVQRVWAHGRFVDGASKCYRRSRAAERMIKLSERPADPALAR